MKYQGNYRSIVTLHIQHILEVNIRTQITSIVCDEATVVRTHTYIKSTTKNNYASFIYRYISKNHGEDTPVSNRINAEILSNLTQVTICKQFQYYIPKLDIGFI